MKKTVMYLILLLVLFSLNGCDTSTTSTIKVVNASSDDLTVKFIPKYSDYKEYNDIDLIKGASSTFYLKDFGPSKYRRPNDEVIKIIFSNLNTGDLIREIDNSIEKVFKLTNSKSDLYGELSAEFLLEITDNLLQ
jgi:hypothetical protein